MLELREVHAAQLEKQKHAEAKLLLKIDELDGGAARAERELEVYFEKIAKQAARQMRNIGLTVGWNSWHEYVGLAPPPPPLLLVSSSLTPPAPSSPLSPAVCRVGTS